MSRNIQELVNNEVFTADVFTASILDDSHFKMKGKNTKNKYVITVDEKHFSVTEYVNTGTKENIKNKYHIPYENISEVIGTKFYNALHPYMRDNILGAANDRAIGAYGPKDVFVNTIELNKTLDSDIYRLSYIVTSESGDHKESTYLHTDMLLELIDRKWCELNHLQKMAASKFIINFDTKRYFIANLYKNTAIEHLSDLAMRPCAVTGKGEKRITIHCDDAKAFIQLREESDGLIRLSVDRYYSDGMTTFGILFSREMWRYLCENVRWIGALFTRLNILDFFKEV